MDDKRYSYYFHPYHTDVDSSVNITGFVTRPNHYVFVDLNPAINSAKISVKLPPGNTVNPTDLPKIESGGVVYEFSPVGDGSHFTVIDINDINYLHLKNGNVSIGQIVIDTRPEAGVAVRFEFTVGTPQLKELS